MARNDQTGYIFAKCKGDRAHIISQIQRIPTVESATPVTGRFDLVIKLRTNEPTKAFTTMERSGASQVSQTLRQRYPSRALSTAPTEETTIARWHSLS